MCSNSVYKPIYYTRLISILGNHKNAKYNYNEYHSHTANKFLITIPTTDGIIQSIV